MYACKKRPTSLLTNLHAEELSINAYKRDPLSFSKLCHLKNIKHHRFVVYVFGKAMCIHAYKASE